MPCSSGRSPRWPAGSSAGSSAGYKSGLAHAAGMGLATGLHYGGRAVSKHVILRLWLVRNGSIPSNYVRFLDHAAERVLLRKVGGGYAFLHPLLLEYFAAPEVK